MSDLLSKRCIPCEGGTEPLMRPAAEQLLKEVSDWQLSGDVKTLSRTYRFNTFAEAMAFANKVAALAEEEGHHPDLSIGWGKVGIELSTHSIGGLSENDFILAAKIDALG